MIFHGSRLIFYGSRWVLMVIHDSGLVFRGSRLVFHDSSWVFTIFHESRSGFNGFRLVLWFQVGFYGSRSILMGFQCFRLFFYGFRSGFHDSRWILLLLMVPGWFKSELGAGGAK